MKMTSQTLMDHILTMWDLWSVFRCKCLILDTYFVMQDPDYKDDNMLTRNGSIPNTKFIKVNNIVYILKHYIKI